MTRTTVVDARWDARWDALAAHVNAPRRDRVPAPVVGEPAWVLDAATLAGMAGLSLEDVARRVGDADLLWVALTGKDGE